MKAVYVFRNKVIACKDKRESLFLLRQNATSKVRVLQARPQKREKKRKEKDRIRNGSKTHRFSLKEPEKGRRRAIILVPQAREIIYKIGAFSTLGLKQ